jgi:hypothetical protein
MNRWVHAEKVSAADVAVLDTDIGWRCIVKLMVDFPRAFDWVAE